jgi:hypothetical protein
MTIQFSTAVRNARLDAIETIIGATAVLRVWSGSAPATPATADSGTKLAEMTLPSDWMSAGSAGAKAKLGTWQDLVADASGTPGHFRIYDSTGAVCGMQGTCSFTGGGGDMTFDSATFTAGQQVTVTGFTLTEGNP